MLTNTLQDNLVEYPERKSDKKLFREKTCVGCEEDIMEVARYVLLYSVLYFCSSINNVRTKNVCKTLEKLLHGTSSRESTEGYDTKKLRPGFDGPPVKVIANSYIVAVDNVNDVKSDFTLKMYFTQTWNDSRLAYGSKCAGFIQKDSIRVTGEIGEKIWKPDTYVENEENIGAHKIFSSVKITRNGMIHLSQRLTVKANCPTMNLRFFPHDVQDCELLLTSYAYPNDELTYEWRADEAVTIGESSIASQYKLDGAIPDVKQQYFKAANATWVYLTLTFLLRRRTTYYIIRIYLPAILVTLTSWVSFWVDPNAIPARLSLCVITVLAMTTLSYNSQSMVPSVPYVKAVDWYLIISFFFVFGSLLEYAILLNLTLRCKRLKGVENKEIKTEEIPLKSKRKNSGIITDDVENGCNGDEFQKKSVKPVKKSAQYFSSWTLDTFSTLFFPAAYILFHLIYFIIILT